MYLLRQRPATHLKRVRDFKWVPNARTYVAC